MKSVGKPIRKKDAMALVTGKPVYTDDLAPKDCLIVKLLRSPHANAIVKNVKKDIAMKVPGIEGIYTWEDVPKTRFTIAGQTSPECSPHDRLILDRQVRFAGDPVAIVAGENEACVDRALKLLKVEYEVLPAVFDPRTALDNPILVHPEDDWKKVVEMGGDNKRNLVSHEEDSHGDVEAVLKDCDETVTVKVLVPAVQQAMMETFRTYCFMDTYGRLNIVSSTQIVYHVRRIIATALEIPKSKIRVSKPRIGGGFGAKQTAVCEMYPAFVTWTTGKPSKIIFTREESQIASSPRHEMEVTVTVGANKDGKIRALDMYTLSNSGAYSEHGPTTVGLSSHKSIPMYNTYQEAHRFKADVVYTNHMAAGAYRGYGATQGLFAVETAVNQLAAKLKIDPVELRLMNVVREGQKMPAYFGETCNSAALDQCVLRVKEMIGWDEKYPCKDMGNGKVRSVGIAMAMQGSCISNLDVGSCTLKLQDDGTYQMSIAAADMGTGCDTILAQMAAECLNCDVDDIAVSGADTDTSPYDSGSYASSTTYITGMSVVKAAQELEQKILATAAVLLGADAEDLEFDGKKVTDLKSGKCVTLAQIGQKSQDNTSIACIGSASHCSPVSPPPYMAGAVEIELDKETGHVELIDYAAVVDCGTVINPNLARVQTEGGIGQGIGMALFEQVQYDARGKMMNNSFMQYKVPTRLDVGKLRIEFRESNEPTGPFGAKSIGEIVINTPAPAIAHAVYNATGLWFTELPITSEKIAMGLLEKCE